MPDAPAAEILEMVSRLTTNPKTNSGRPRQLQAPRHASKVITVRAVEGTEVNVNKIPNDVSMRSSFSLCYEEGKASAEIPDDAPDILYVQWLNNCVEIRFCAAPPENTEQFIRQWWENTEGLKEAIPDIRRFRFRNGVVYKRVPLEDPERAGGADELKQLTSENNYHNMA